MIYAFFAGIVLLYLGSEALLKGGTSIALRLNIKPLVIGLTVIAFGTSSPELMVSIKAAWTNHGDISAGDNIGSNIFNVAGILSICAFFKPIPLNRQILKFDMPVMFLAYLLLSIFIYTGKISRWAGILFIILIIIYTLAVYLMPKRRTFQEKEIAAEIEKPLKNIYLDLLFIVGGLSFLIYGGNLVVKGAVYFAKLFEINEANIALGMVAVSTSIPEATCCLVAIWRKKYDILVGSIIGSNIFNVFAVIGIAAAIKPFEVVNIRVVDIGMMFLTGTILFPFFQKELVLNRIKAFVLLSIYLIYVFLIYFK